jgi:hypothetical protein
MGKKEEFLEIKHTANVYCLLQILMQMFPSLCIMTHRKKRQISPITGLDKPRGFQEVQVPRFFDNGTGWW